MNKIERVRAALRGQTVDHVPASFWFHFPADRVAGQAMADAHLAYYRHASPDWLKVMSDNGYPLTDGVTLATPADWRKLRSPSPKAPQFQAQLDGLKRIADAIGQEALIITTIFNVFSTGNNLNGKRVTEQMQQDPAAVSAGLGVIAEGLAIFGRACLEAGASGIFFSAQGGEADRFSREVFEKYLKPHDLTVLRAVKGAEFNLLHVCGYNLRLDEYADYPAHAVNWSPHWNNLSLLDGWKIFPKMALIGGMDQRGPLVTGPAEAIKAEAHAVLNAIGKNHFLLGAGCTLPNDVSWDNIKLAIEHCHTL